MLPGGVAGWAVAGVAGCVQEAGERCDCLEQQRVDPGVVVGVVTGAELGDGVAVFGLGGELADPGGDGRGHAGGGAAGRGAVSPG